MEKFEILRTARNIFVHTGIAFNMKTKQPLTEEEARELINNSKKVILNVREWLPEKIQWKAHKEYSIVSFVDYDSFTGYAFLEV